MPMLGSIAEKKASGMMRRVFAMLVCMAACGTNFAIGADDSSGWITLFNGTSLDGWHVSAKTGHSGASKNTSGGRWVVEDGAIARFLEDADLRSRVSLWDCNDQTKVAAARTSLGVHFEWFLRDDYRVKVRPAQAFTGGLLVRGIISLGM